MRSEQSSIAIRLICPEEEELEMIASGPKERMAVVITLGSSEEFCSRFIESGLAIRLVSAGAVLFSLVGNASEKAHDALDWALEKCDVEDIVTSWHDEDGPEEVASFVIASCRAGSLSRLLAVVDQSTEFEASLKKQIREAIWTDVSE